MNLITFIFFIYIHKSIYSDIFHPHSFLFTHINLPLQQNVSLTTNFSEKKLLVIIVANLNTNLQSKKLLALL